MPLAFTRVYRPLDGWSRRMQMYLMDVYDPYLVGERNPYSLMFWYLPDDQFLYYKRISPGGGFADGLFEHRGSMPLFGGSRIAWNGWGWDVSLADGKTYLTPEAYDSTRVVQSSLVGIFDSVGNEIRLTREENGNLTEIRSPNGHWIRITYAGNRVVRVENDSYDQVTYEYDGSNRLVRTESSSGQKFEYLYDPYNRIVHVADSKVGGIVRMFYDSEDRVGDLVLVDHRRYHFDYVSDLLGNVTEADVTGPGSEVTRVKLHADNYTIEKSQ